MATNVALEREKTKIQRYMPPLMYIGRKSCYVEKIDFPLNV